VFDLGPFTRPEWRGAPRAHKRDYRGVTNLASNELELPELQAEFAVFCERLAALPAARYPYWPAARAAFAAAGGLAEDHVLLCAGSDDAIKMVAFCLLPRRQLIASAPLYASYADYAGLAGGDVVNESYVGHPADVHLAALRARLDGLAPSVVVVANPNGFTGAAIEPAALDALAGDLRRGGHVLVIDEAYASFAELDHAALVHHGNVIVIRSFSKSHGAAGLRLAAVIAAAPLIELLERWRPSNGLTSPSLAFLAFSLERPAAVRAAQHRVRARRDRVAAALAAAGWRALSSRTNFLCIDAGARAIRDAAVARLAAAGIATRALEDGALATCLRMAITTDDAMDRALAALGARP
jgi:histidinol-phosphate aminotransferase